MIRRRKLGPYSWMDGKKPDYLTDDGYLKLSDKELKEAKRALHDFYFDREWFRRLEKKKD